MAKQDDELEDFGRFTEPALLILISLADGAKHGYAMTAMLRRWHSGNSSSSGAWSKTL